MGSNRFLRCKPKRRPKKSPSEKRRRENTHAKRLEALGMKPDTVKAMSSKDKRTALRKPAKVKADAAA